MIFSERISELRKDRRVQQKDLAPILGVEVQALGNYERGLNEPSFDVVVKLAEYYNVSLDYLFGITDEEIELDRKNVIVLPKGFPEDEKEKVLHIIDLVIKAQK